MAEAAAQPARRTELKADLFFWILLLVLCAHFVLAWSTELPMFYSLRDYAISGTNNPTVRLRPLMAILMKPIMLSGAVSRITAHLGKPFSDAAELTLALLNLVLLFLATEATRRAALAAGVHATIARWGSLLVPYMCYFDFILTPEIRFQQAYDVTTVACFAICLWAALTRNRWFFYPAFAISTVNKETTIFLIGLWGLLEWAHLSPRFAPRTILRLFMDAIPLFVIWYFVHQFSIHFFPGPTGAVSVKCLPQNVGFFMKPMHWPTMLSTFGFAWILYLAQFRRIRHPGLQLCGIMGPVWFLVSLVVGDMIEVRIHAEWTAYLTVCLLLIAATYYRAWRSAPAPAPLTA